MCFPCLTEYGFTLRAHPLTPPPPLNELYQHISEQQTAHPDAFLILAGDFNHRPKECVPQNTPTCCLSNTGKQHSGLCLHHPERSLQGPTPPPSWHLRPHHCHANSSIQTDRQSHKTSSQTDTSVAGRVVRGTSRLF